MLVQVVALLGAEGADVHAVDIDSLTALHLAAHARPSEQTLGCYNSAVRALLQQSASAGALDCYWRTVADLAAMSGHTGLARELKAVCQREQIWKLAVLIV